MLALLAFYFRQKVIQLLQRYLTVKGSGIWLIIIHEKVLVPFKYFLILSNGKITCLTLLRHLFIYLLFSTYIQGYLRICVIRNTNSRKRIIFQLLLNYLFNCRPCYQDLLFKTYLVIWNSLCHITMTQVKIKPMAVWLCMLGKWTQYLCHYLQSLLSGFYNTLPWVFMFSKTDQLSIHWRSVKKLRNTFHPLFLLTCLPLFFGVIFKVSCQPLGSCWAAFSLWCLSHTSENLTCCWWWKIPAVTNF